MTENEIDVRIVGDASGVAPATAEAKGEVKGLEEAIAAMSAQMAGLSAAIKESMVAGAKATAEMAAEMKVLEGETEREAISLRELAASAKEGVAAIVEMKEAALGFGELLLAAFAIEELEHWADKMGEAAEKTKHVSEQLGLTTKETQALQGAATAVGIPFDKLVTGLGLLDKRFETEPKLFKQLGIILPQNASQMQILEATMERFKGLDDGPQKTALALTLMGRAGKELIPFMNEGAKGLEELFEKANKYGQVSADATTKGVALAEALNEGKLAMMGLSNTMTSAFAPMLQRAVEGFDEMVAAITKSYREGGAAKIIFDGMAATFEAVGTVIGMVAKAFEPLGTATKFVSDNIGTILPIGAALAVLFAGPMVASLVASTVATIAQSEAMGALVAGFISEGLIGAATAAWGLFSAGVAAATAATVEFTIALLANPLTWIAVACAAAAGGMVWLAMHVRSARDAFDFLWDGVKIVGTYIMGEIDVLEIGLRTFSKIALDALTLNWGAIQSDWDSGLKGIQDSVQATANNIKALMDDAKSHLYFAYSGSDDKYDPHALDEIMHQKKPDGPGVDLQHHGKTKKPKKEPKEKDTAVQEAEAGLEAQKVKFAELQAAQGTYENFSLADEEKFWDQQRKRTDLSEKDLLEIRKKWLAARMAVHREEQSNTLSSIKINESIQMDAAKTEVALARYAVEEKIALVEQAAQAGDITNTEALRQKALLNQELIQLDMDLATKEYQVKRGAIVAEMLFGQLTKDQRVKLNGQLAALDEAYANQSVTINKKADTQKEKDDAAVVLAQQKIFQQTYQGFADNIGKMVSLQQGFMATLRGSWQSLQGIVAQAVSNMVMRWAAGLAAKDALQQASHTKSVFLTAKEAAGHAWDSVVHTPFIGPILAPIAAAASFAGVMAFAEGGYDIPSGVNPITQLHQNEMVLPAHIAMPLRSMLAGGAPAFAANDTGPSAGGDIHLHVSAVDGQSVKRMFMDNKHALAAAVKDAVRHGSR
jgi:hypothetical protein